MILHVKCHLNDVRACDCAVFAFYTSDWGNRQNVKIWYPTRGANLIFAILGTK